jgi:hypothetical protein
MRARALRSPCRPPASQAEYSSCSGSPAPFGGGGLLGVGGGGMGGGLGIYANGGNAGGTMVHPGLRLARHPEAAVPAGKAASAAASAQP